MIESLEPAMLDLHGARWVETDRYEIRKDAKRFETWESSPALRLGLAAACNYALGVGLGAIWARVASLAAILRAALLQLGGVTVHDKGRVKGGIVTFNVAGVEASQVQAELLQRRIYTSVASVFSARIDMEQRGLAEVVRASVHYFNTEDELDRLVGAVAEIARR
jgi:selenocysteine lyase/cysteine desulfurase